MTGASVALWAAMAGAQLAEPVHVRNLNPLVSIFGLPAWDTVPIGTRFGVTAEVANHYRFSLEGNERLMLDGETVRTNFAFTHGFATGWSLGVEVPYYNVSGGVLDDAIDAWHSAFGMPDGGRNARPEDELLYAFGLDPLSPSFVLTEPQTGVGDTQVKFARLIGGEQGFVVQATVKLPTGDEDMLAGSGSSDWSVTLLRTRPLLARKRAAGYYWGVGLVRAGDAELVEFDANTWVPTGIIGGSWQLLPEFGFKGQIDVHGAFYDSQLEEIGETAIQATFSAWRRMGQRGQIELAVVEDLNVSTAPDVVLQVAAAWQF
ncbi:MAG TPA: DUF3187 family protein [Gammaproteobacteria bacterium]|nr:DUF3187 family protein [Gammaproteobacteria bacterium]